MNTKNFPEAKRLRQIQALELLENPSENAQKCAGKCGGECRICIERTKLTAQISTPKRHFRSKKHRQISKNAII